MLKVSAESSATPKKVKPENDHGSKFPISAIVKEEAGKKNPVLPRSRVRIPLKP